MLMAEGTYQLPRQVVANSFLNIKFPGQEEQKISKSRGTAIWIEEYLKTFDPDPLRYYLTAIAPETSEPLSTSTTSSPATTVNCSTPWAISSTAPLTFARSATSTAGCRKPASGRMPTWSTWR